jgi:hypothetical protein
LAQVRRIAPQDLIGRETELRETADFSTAPRQRPYLWWRADAWAGKSALMSTFVLDPPSSVRVVSFFITARFAGQADRIAFSDVVLEQLLELLGEPRPTFLTEATRDAHLLGALSRAAALCRDNGKRLILVIDGLDEDQGVTSGPDTHSIAALLPADPPAGMRIIVASRLNPSVPPDVPEVHPLRDPAVVRLLSPSPHAEVIRHDAESELKKLIRSSSPDRDLLGIVTAAGGGLSSEDLAYLTGMSTWEVEDHLGAAAGRMFVPRSGLWQSEAKVYVLGHEELQRQATRFLGAERLDDYRMKLHRWADSYRVRRWPADTPDYLFRGYFRLLQATNDLSKMLVYATDPDRHNRMLDLVGGDTSALAEIAATQEAFLERGFIDLVAISRLAVHRSTLESRNSTIPSNLPSVWAQLGRLSRAEALARSINNATRQIRALVAVIRKVSDAGDRSRARILSAHAEHTLDLIDEPFELALALALVARSYADADDPQQAIRLLDRGGVVAESLRGSAQHATLTAALARAYAAAGEISVARRLAESIEPWSERTLALVAVVTEVSRWGYFETAQQIAASIHSHAFVAQAAAAIAKEMAAVGEMAAAATMADKARLRARSVRDSQMRVWALAHAADAMRAAGLPEHASALLDKAGALTNAIPKQSAKEDALVILARLLAATGSPDRAVEILQEITKPARRAKGLAAIASGLATWGAPAPAMTYATESESVGRSIVVPINESRALAALSQAAAAARILPQAERIARLIPDEEQRDRAFTVIVQAVAVAGDLDHAVEISASIVDSAQRAKAAVLVAKAAASLGQFRRVADIVRSIEDDEQRDEAFRVLESARRGTRLTAASESAVRASVTPVLADAAVTGAEGDSATAAAIIASHPEVYPQAKALTAFARKIAASDDPYRALDIASLIENVPLRVGAFAEVAEAAKTGDPYVADVIVERAIELTESIADSQIRDRTLSLIAIRLGDGGDVKRTEQVAQAIQSAEPRAKALTAAARAAAASDQRARAASILELIEQPRERDLAYLAVVQTYSRRGHFVWAEDMARSIPNIAARGRALSMVAQAWAAAGQPEAAERIACSLVGYPQQAQLLVSLAAGASAEDSRRLIAQSLTIGDWQLCLPLLLRIEPRAIEAMVEEVTRSGK